MLDTQPRVQDLNRFSSAAACPSWQHKGPWPWAEQSGSKHFTSRAAPLPPPGLCILPTLGTVHASDKALLVLGLHLLGVLLEGRGTGCECHHVKGNTQPRDIVNNG